MYLSSFAAKERVTQYEKQKSKRPNSSLFWRTTPAVNKNEKN